MRPRPRHAALAPRVAIAIDDAVVAGDMERVFAARGIEAEPVPLDTAIALAERAAPGRDQAGDSAGTQVVGYAPDHPPTPDLAARLSPMCQASAESGCPVVILSAFTQKPGKDAWLRAASIAYLRAAGAIVCHDPDEWIETICLIAGHGLPDGPTVAIVAPPGGLLSASATSLANEAEILGDRFPAIATSPSRMQPVDLALVDRAALSPSTPDRVGQAMIVPVIARSELLDDDDRFPLVGLRAALGAAFAAGRLAERLHTGLGPDLSGREDPRVLDRLEPDIERFDRQLDKLATRAGDHETKVLLSAWGIPVTRQAVATTPSAATRVAKKAGYPVEIKPWGPDQLSEAEGCPLQRGLSTAADVRRAVAHVARAAGLPLGAPVIVRETPPEGRDVCARVVKAGSLGWMVGLEIAGVLFPACAPAPLRPEDAAELSRAVEASRASDPAPDRDALADILLRASHLAVYHEHAIEALYLHRIVVTQRDRESVVVDAQAVLKSANDDVF